MNADLKPFSCLSDLTDGDRDILVDLMSPVDVRAGRRLFRAGSGAEGLVLLLSGEIDLESPRSSGKARIGPGSVLGMFSLIAVGPHEATARAHSACRLLVLERGRFRRLADDYPRTSCRLLESLMKEAARVTRAALDEFAPGA